MKTTKVACTDNDDISCPCIYGGHECCHARLEKPLEDSGEGFGYGYWIRRVLKKGQHNLEVASSAIHHNYSLQNLLSDPRVVC